MFNIGDAINPYLLYVKIGALILAVCGVIGVGVYIRHVFADRTRLQTETGKLRAELVTERQKYTVLMQQTQQMLELNKKIIEAVRRVKVNSTVYIDKVEASKLSAPVAGGTVLVPGGMRQAMPPDAAMSIFNGYSAGGSGSGPA